MLGTYGEVGLVFGKFWVIHFLNSLCHLMLVHFSGSEDLLLACFTARSFVSFDDICICQRCDGLSLQASLFIVQIYIVPVKQKG